MYHKWLILAHIPSNLTEAEAKKVLLANPPKDCAPAKIVKIFDGSMSKIYLLQVEEGKEEVWTYHFRNRPVDKLVAYRVSRSGILPVHQRHGIINREPVRAA